MSDPRFRDQWSEKARSVAFILQHFDLTIDEVVEPYQGQSFVDGHPKQEVFREVLSGSPTKQTIEYLDLRCSEGFGHLRGDRSGAEYAADLVLGWMVEDGFKLWAYRAGLTAVHAGHDKNREFLRPGKISAASDFTIGKSDQRRLELATDYKGYWKRANKWDMRDSKFQKLKQEQALIFLIDVMHVQGAVIDLSKSEDYDFEYLPFHFQYKKPAWALKKVREYLVPLDEAVRSLVETVT